MCKGGARLFQACMTLSGVKRLLDLEYSAILSFYVMNAKQPKLQVKHSKKAKLAYLNLIQLPT